MSVWKRKHGIDVLSLNTGTISVDYDGSWRSLRYAQGKASSVPKGKKTALKLAEDALRADLRIVEAAMKDLGDED